MGLLRIDRLLQAGQNVFLSFEALTGKSVKDLGMVSETVIYPLFMNITTYADTLYFLDQARNQVWRQQKKYGGYGVLPGTLPWLLKEGETDISAGIDQAIDGDVYVLQRQGVVKKFQGQQKIGHVDIAELNTFIPVSQPIRTNAVFIRRDTDRLFIADPGRRRVLICSKENLQVKQQLVVPGDPNFSLLSSVCEKDGMLYMLAGPVLHGFPLADWERPIQDLCDPPAAWAVFDAGKENAETMPPNDPRMTSFLAGYEFSLPVQPDQGLSYLQSWLGSDLTKSLN